MVMGPTYQRLSQVYTQTEANPAKFLLVSLTICLMAALLFARTRGSWAAGWKGGLAFGFFLGLVIFFQRFYDPMVIATRNLPVLAISMIDSLPPGRPRRDQG
jgi:ABC-type nitrate/sulfonate/bicarbonate transport system permease component